MQTEQQLQQAAKEALKSAAGHAFNLLELLEAMQLTQSPQHVFELMPECRSTLAELTQRVHEFNAYHNALRQ